MLMLYLSMLDNDKQRNIFEERYYQYHYDCLRVADNILHNATLAEDAVHEAFLSVIEARDKYLSLSCRDFRRLIVIIVRNKCLNMIKKDKNIADFPVDDILFNVPDESPSVEEQIIRAADVEEVSEYISKLDELSRQILYLKYDRQLSYKEIAKDLCLKEKTVEVRLTRAKSKIRKMINEGGVHI